MVSPLTQFDLEFRARIIYALVELSIVDQFTRPTSGHVGQGQDAGKELTAWHHPRSMSLITRLYQFWHFRLQEVMHGARVGGNLSKEGTPARWLSYSVGFLRFRNSLGARQVLLLNVNRRRTYTLLTLVDTPNLHFFPDSYPQNSGNDRHIRFASLSASISELVNACTNLARWGV